MHLFVLLSAILLILAVLLWYTQARTREENPPQTAVSTSAALRPDAGTVEALSGAVAAMQALLQHPALGGPGFLTVRFLQRAVAVTAQYPNIQEVLYRRVIRQELTPPDLLAVGFPESLLKLSPEFEFESGGMVLVTVRIFDPDPALFQALTNHRTRQTVLHNLALELGRQCPGLSIRLLGGELILTPIRETTEV